MSEYKEYNNISMIRAVVICRSTGEFLVDMLLDSNIDPVMIGGFCAALSMFGEESLGKISTISIEGLDVDMIIENKHDLLFIAITDKDFSRNEIRAEARNLLDAFTILYKNEIDNATYFNSNTFNDFKGVIMAQIQHIHTKKKLFNLTTPLNLELLRI